MEVNLSISWDVFVVQLINFAIVYRLFSKFVAKPLIAQLNARRESLIKAEEADKYYEKVLADAEEQKRSILDDALAHKQQLIQQSESAATLKAEKILADAKTNADGIAMKAQQEAAKLESELKNSYVSGVKHISQLVLKKIIWKDTDVQDTYIQEVMKQVG